MTKVATAARRPLRSDAERNRRRILLAAADVVSASGEDACMDDIAARAGVGVGTLYRRFPTKDDLFVALVDELTIRLADAARSALTREPATALEDFLRQAGRTFAECRGYLPRLWNRTSMSAPMKDLRGLLVELLNAAQQAGEIGESVKPGDLSVLLWSMRGVVETTGDVAPDAWQRHLDIHLAGMRCTPLPTSRPAISQATADRIVLSRRMPNAYPQRSS